MIIVYAETTENEAEILQTYYDESLYKGSSKNMVKLEGNVLPEPPEVEIGKNFVRYINKTTNEVIYRGVERPLTPEETIQQLKEQQTMSDQMNAELVFDNMMKDERLTSLEEQQATLIFQLMEGGVI